MNSQLVREAETRERQTYRPRPSQGGYVLVTAMILVMGLLGVGAAFMRWSTDEAIQSRHVSGAMQAYYLGQMGVIEKGLQWMRSREPSDLPIGEVVLPGRNVPGVGKYEDVRIMFLAGQSGGDFWALDKMYRISAVGVVTTPWNVGDDTKTIRRKSVLYVSLRSFSDYMYLSDHEMTTFGDRIRFWHEDTLNGRVHSNYQIAIMENPVFYEQVTQAGNWTDFEHGTGYAPVFLGPPPKFRVRPVLIPEVAENLRNYATNYFNPGTDKQMRMVINGSTLHHYTWDLGEAFDSLEAVSDQIEIPQGEDAGLCVFTETRLELAGTEITGRVTIGSAQLIRLMDDIRVRAAYTNGAPEYRVLPSCPDYVGIVSEGDIKIANTPRNGRENCNGFGPGGTNNQNLKDIVITAAVVALGNPFTGSAGSFTFENQNDDVDSGYSGPSPDERGTIWLYGSLTQRRRGYVHRSNHGGTGYAKQYRYDSRFLQQRPPCFFEAVDSTGHALFDIVQWGQGVESPPEVNRGNVVRYN